MYRERMRPKVSFAEQQVFVDLSADNLTEGLFTQFKIDIYAVTEPCNMPMKARQMHSFEVLLDFAWPHRMKCLHLDGDRIHAGRRSDLDGVIDCALKRLGWQVLRLAYHAPLTKTRRAEIREANRQWLGE